MTALSGGDYIAVPGERRISQILKLLPGESLDDALRDLEAAVRADRPPRRAHLRLPAGPDHRFGGTSTETSPGLPFARLLTEAVRAVHPGRGAIEGALYWSEAPFLSEQLEVRTICCAQLSYA